MRDTDVKDNRYIDSNKEANEKDPTCQIGDHVRISQNRKKKIAKGYTPNCSEEVFVIKKS